MGNKQHFDKFINYYLLSYSDHDLEDGGGQYIIDVAYVHRESCTHDVHQACHCKGA